MRVDLPRIRATSPELTQAGDQRGFRLTLGWSLVVVAVVMAVVFLTVVFGAVGA